MRLLNRFHTVCVVLLVFCFLMFSPAGVLGKKAEEGPQDTVGLIDVQECEGVEVTQCELAKNLIMTLKMGEDLTCEACFIHLRALGIAPAEDWSYEDPHKVVTLEAMREVVLEIHQAYNDGMVRLDGFEAAAGINDFCREMKGPAAAPAPSEQEKKETEMPSALETQEHQDQGSTPAEEVVPEEDTPTSGAEEPGM